MKMSFGILTWLKLKIGFVSRSDPEPKCPTDPSDHTGTAIIFKNQQIYYKIYPGTI